MKVGDLRTGDRIALKNRFGYILEATHCEHGLSKIVHQMDDENEPHTNGHMSDKEVTSGLEVIGAEVIEEVPTL